MEKTTKNTAMEKTMIDQLKEFKEIQGREGNYNYSPYMLGMYNGMELMLAILEDRDPVYKEVREGEFLEDKQKTIN